MKKMFKIFISLALLLILTSCQDIIDYAEEIRPVYHAPVLTLEEANFVEMLPPLIDAGIAVTNTSPLNTETGTRKGSGVIFKQVENGLSNTYYALTTQWVVENALTVKVYLGNETVDATVLNPKLEYDANEDIAVIRFTSNNNYGVVQLKPIEEDRLLNSLTIFSIATPISNAYFNFVTNPATIMGVYDTRIVHGTNLNPGTLGSPLYLYDTGEIIGINVKYSHTAGGRPEVLINEAIHINQVIELIEGYL